MKKETSIQVTIETPAVGNIYMTVPYDKNEEGSKFTIDIPNQHFVYTTYTTIDLTHVVEHDIEHFKQLNNISDENHQVYINTLCIYGIKIMGNFIRVQYWFNQDGDETSHRMCAGVITSCNGRTEHDGQSKRKTIYPECYSSDVCVYW